MQSQDSSKNMTHMPGTEIQGLICTAFITYKQLFEFVFSFHLHRLGKNLRFLGI